MRMIRMGKRRIFCLLSIPLVFLLTVIVLSSHLLGLTDWMTREVHEGRSKLIAARRRALSKMDVTNEASVLKFQVFQLYGHKPDIMDKVYDTNQLLMLGVINTREDEDVRDDGKRQHAFNELISERLSLHRAVPDTRHPLCQSKTFRNDLPKASVIICFYNEAWSTLLRTVHSVIDRSPPDQLYEIVLVDDNSDMPHLQTPLAEYIWSLKQNIKLVRLPERQGLIRARMYGALATTAEVIVFLDSHCEVNTHWLEPLLTAIADNHRLIAIPVIDIISPDTFEYQSSPIVKGGFNWGLHFRWDHLPDGYFDDDESHTNPIETPTMAGGLFAINRQYFREMGEYDPGMDVWGGENLEISFRIWQCGGRLEILPCSRVGHIFRKRRPYGSPGGEDTMVRNSLRVAKVWMDDYIQYFYQVRSEAASVDAGNITDRLALRQKLDCQSFKWYLEYTYPEQVIPDENGRAPAVIGKVNKFVPTYKRHGIIKHSATGLCLQSEGDIFTKKSKVILAPCSKGNKTQNWYESDRNELVLSQVLCLDIEDVGLDQSYARLMKCHGSGGSQAWVWSIKNAVYQLYNPTSGKCLTDRNIYGKHYLMPEICSVNPKESTFKLVGLLR